MGKRMMSKDAPLIDKLKARYGAFLDTAINPATVMSEVIGVFVLVLLGTGAAVLTNAPDIYPPEMSRMGKEALIGFAFGFAILVMIYATAHNGSGHLNPAVTIAFIASGVCSVAQGLLNIVGQVCGALIASGILKSLLPDELRGNSGLGANAVPAEQTSGRAFVAEMVGGFIAMFVILETIAHPKTKAGDLAPLAVGLTFGTLLTVLSPISSGSFNPARTFGPAVVANQFDDLWVWIIGPILGMLLAVPFHLLSSAQLKNRTYVAGRVWEDDDDDDETPAKELAPESGSPRRPKSRMASEV